ncbi:MULTISPECIES: hypothetical protein [Halomonas]|uniref:Phosphatidate cytidylyltransferase n=1 Tax=Halomonas ventosae TaxID=229007 RepID=A0A4R6HIE0_9GAMM|nr:hypothetical protein [Halomonas ventosae]TDO07745.1 hypothetical protein DFO68_108110 [Halomonas ventosae]
MSSATLSPSLSPSAALLEQVARQCATAVSPALAPLRERVLARFGTSVCAVLFYGSCLRDAAPGEGVVDLYAVVDDYRTAYDRRVLRLTNEWLPPNVFFLEAEDGAGGRLRAKCAVISLHDFEVGCTRAFQSYLWGRFAQPCRLVHCRDEATRARLHRALAGAVIKLWQEALPCLPQRFTASEGWRRALELSYGVELRPEGASRPGVLVAGFEAEYRALTAGLAESLPALTAIDSDHFAHALDAATQQQAQRRWRRRQRQGHLWHILRLMKSVLTFENGVDYLAWKLERHSGRRIEVTPRLRRHPLIFGWPFLWRLLRERVLR